MQQMLLLVVVVVGVVLVEVGCLVCVEMWRVLGGVVVGTQIDALLVSVALQGFGSSLCIVGDVVVTTTQSHVVDIAVGGGERVCVEMGWWLLLLLSMYYLFVFVMR